MNIFYLDKEPERAASFHCDKHNVKMIVESAQMLSTAQWYAEAERLSLLPWNGKQSDLWREMARIHRQAAGFDTSGDSSFHIRDIRKQTAHLLPDSLYAHIYSPTHANHPSAVWARSTKEQYNWLADLSLELCYEYTRRYKRRHKTQTLIEWCVANPPDVFPSRPFVEPPQCMPNDSKINGDTVGAYRQYYIKHKAYMAKWAHSKTPDWWKQSVQ